MSGKAVHCRQVAGSNFCDKASENFIYNISFSLSYLTFKDML